MSFEVTVKWDNHHLGDANRWDYPTSEKMGLVQRGYFKRDNFRSILPPDYYYDKPNARTFTYRRLNCAFTGRASVFEPLDLDMIVQEIDGSINTIGYQLWHPDNGLPLSITERPTQESVLPGTDYESVISCGHKVANATAKSLSYVLSLWFSITWPPLTHFASLDNLPRQYLDWIKWVKPSKNEYDLYDGPETKIPGKISLLKSFPSMIRSDTKCNRRVRRHRSLCNDPVTGARGKLALVTASDMIQAITNLFGQVHPYNCGARNHRKIMMSKPNARLDLSR